MWSRGDTWRGVYLPSLFKINWYLHFHFISSWWISVIFHIFLGSVVNMSVVIFLKTGHHRLNVMTYLMMGHQKSSDQGSLKKCQHFLLLWYLPKESQQFKRKIVMQLFWKFPLGVTTRRTTRRTTTRRTTTRRMMYARGGSGGSGSCPAGSLDNCIDACPTQVGGHLHKNTIIWTINHNFRHGHSRRARPVAAEGAKRNNTQWCDTDFILNILIISEVCFWNIFLKLQNYH